MANKLANSIKDKKSKNFPELDEEKCDFGKWLINDAKKMINHLKRDESHVLLTYLEKCEFISLSIGTELALIDNMLINKQISKDSLTGAVSRRGLKSIFMNQYELSLATNNSFVLAMCDLDNFKKINDTFGHVAGDKVLKHFVDIVKKHIRNSDIIIRYGGEEFTIILPAIDKTNGFKVLEKIRKDFKKNVLKFNGKSIETTVSMGLIEVHPESYYKKHFLDEYIMIADQKLYYAKNSGRNKIEF
ncbi:sensor domain-containing diguanylate cyclase [Candidatus Sulfurimonas marisnigri]|uniref:sensor domain-containing diguanylate cyclase n=1 Tax=Candidatus Sulfurimonas marisnigri TaxID=2740405 RepID=UPI001E4540E0|nr:sensor domain-containing diguanylate cyclase [Candidatus Sulfurimonas marisnigri]